MTTEKKNIFQELKDTLSAQLRAALDEEEAEEAEKARNAGKAMHSEAADTTEQAADEAEQAADTTEQAADTTEQAADTTEQAADTTEQAADEAEQAADTTEQATDTTEQAADTTEQAADTTEQAADEAEPTADEDITVADDQKLMSLAECLQKAVSTEEILRELNTTEAISDVTKVYEVDGNVAEKDGTETHTQSFDVQAIRIAYAEELKREEKKNRKKSDSEKREKTEPNDDSEDGEEYTRRDFRLIRRSRHYRTGLLGGILYFLFVVAVSVALASCAWLAADDALSLSKDYIEADVYVGENMSMDEITAELYAKGMIRYKPLFRVFAKISNAYEKIQPGVYHLSTRLDYRALVQNMKKSSAWTAVERNTVMLMIPEGKTLKQTFQILAEHGVCPYETMVEYASSCELDYERYDFLPEDLPEGERRLEGYLFPDTYEFFADSEPEEVIRKFLDNFDARMSDNLREQVQKSKYSLHEIITIASLIEMEAGRDSERGLVASVIYNRLSSSSYPYLQIDATIQYALEERKESLSDKDLEVDSPYNTYLHQGLPPGPIANPGLASIRAALNPESTGYYFYALSTEGTHKFFSSYNEFKKFTNSSDFGG